MTYISEKRKSSKAEANSYHIDLKESKIRKEMVVIFIASVCVCVCVCGGGGEISYLLIDGSITVLSPNKKLLY